MRRGLLWAVLALLLISASAFASYGQGGYGNQSGIHMEISREGGVDTLVGSLYYVEFGALVSDDFQKNILNNQDNTGSALIRQGMRVLPNEKVEVWYTNPSGDLVRLEPVQTTDAEGVFRQPLGGVQFGATRKCLDLTANFTGNNYITASPAKETVTYCFDRTFTIPLAGVDWASCVPVFVIFGILAGAMYASGNDPLKAFDISTPRLPGPKNKQMSGEARFMPGWKVQRQMQMRAISDTEKGMKHQLAMLESNMSLLKGTALETSGLRALQKNYSGNEWLIRNLRNARELTWAQRSLLIEMIYLGAADKRIFLEKVTGVNKSQLQASLMASNSGNSAGLKQIRRTMEDRMTKRDVGDVKNAMKRMITRYEKEAKFLTESKKTDANRTGINALQSLSWLTGTADAREPGLRETNEQAKQTFEVARRWAGLGSRKMMNATPEEARGMRFRKIGDKVGEFIAKTPGLRGEFASMITSVRLGTRLHVNTLKGLAVDGALGGTVRKMDNKIGNEFGAVRSARQWLDKKEGLSHTKKTVGTAGNFPELMSLEIRSIVAELKRRGKAPIDDKSEEKKAEIDSRNLQKIVRDRLKAEVDVWNKEEKAKKDKEMNPIFNPILRKSAELLREADEINGSKISPAEKLAMHKDLQAKYRQLFDTQLRPEMDDAVEKQTQREQGSAQVGELHKTINRWMTKQIDVEENEAKVKGDAKSPEVVALKSKLWAGAAEDVFGRRGTMVRKGKLERIVDAIGVDAIEGETLEAASKGVSGYKAQIESALSGMGTPKNDADRRVAGQLAKNREVLGEIEASVNRIRVLKGSGDRYSKFGESEAGAAKQATDNRQRDGYMSSQAISQINMLLDKQKKPKITLSGEEIRELKRFSEELALEGASEGAPIMMQRRYRHGGTVEYHDRRKLVTRLERILRENPSEVEGLLKATAFENAHENIAQIGPRIRLDEKHIAETELKARYDQIMNKSTGNREKAERLTDLMIESLPWYRKKQQEYAETIIRSLAEDKRSAARSPMERELEDKNFLSVNMRESERRLKSYLAAGEETLERGILPGGRITLEEAMRTGAWVQRGEAYWMPATASKETRRPGPGASQKDIENYDAYTRRKGELEEYVQKHLAGADRIVYGYVGQDGKVIDRGRSEETGEIRNKSPWWERSILAGIYDMGYDSLPVRANITQTWQSLNYLRNRYENTEMVGVNGIPTTLGEMKSNYVTNEFMIKKLESDSDYQVYALKQERAKAKDFIDVERIDRQIAAEKSALDGQIADIKRTMKTQKGLLHAAGYEPSVADMWNRFVHGSGAGSANSAGMGGAGLSPYQKFDAKIRGVYGTAFESGNLDPVMAGLSMRYAEESYGMFFLGIIGVRSGRAMSSLYDTQGYIATGQSAWGNAVMEPRKGNWTEIEWAETDVAKASFPGSEFQSGIPVLRHMTYGNFLRMMATPAIMANQPVAGAMRQSNLASGGIPSPWEPQYQQAPAGFLKSLGYGLQGISGSMPFPFNVIGTGAFGTNINPVRSGAFKNMLYSQHSKVAYNYSLEGKTDREGWSVGGPIYRMGNIDQYFMGDYGGPYPPMIYRSPFMKQRSFPAWVGNLSARTPGMVGSHFDIAQPEVFRRETDAVRHYEMRAPYEHMDASGNPKNPLKTAIGEIYDHPVTLAGLAKMAAKTTKMKFDQHRPESITTRIAMDKRREENEFYNNIVDKKINERYRKIPRNRNDKK